VLAAGRFFDAYGGINGYILITSKKYYMDIYFTFSLIFSAIVLNYLLIPLYGGLGSAWATAIVISLYNLLRIAYLWKLYKLSPFEWSNLKVGVIAILISLPLFFIPFGTLNPLLAIAIKGTYLTGTFAFLILYFRVEPELNSYYTKIVARFFRSRS
jgi:O-antigen/teichoic acid export membrane protein